MQMSEKAQEMVTIIRNDDVSLRNNNDMNKSYFAPNIPEKILKKLITHFDSHLPVNSILAFYDGSLFNSAKSGLIFTADGIYDKFMGKPIYVAYKDISSMRATSGSIDITARDGSTYSAYGCAHDALVKTIEKLIKIDSQYGQSMQKSSGTVKKLDLPPDIMNKCHGIIHTASVACGGVGTGLAQIPLSDNAVIVPIQITMIISLGAVFELDITESTAKGIITSAGASIAGRGVSQLLLGWIPGLGNAINTATAAGLTETIGWLAVNNFYDRWIQDRNKGRYEAMKDGYVEASGEYERKLKRQADEFLNQMRDVQLEHDAYEELLDEYERYIVELEKKCASADAISEARTVYRKLIRLEP